VVWVYLSINAKHSAGSIKRNLAMISSETTVDHITPQYLAAIKAQGRRAAIEEMAALRQSMRLSLSGAIRRLLSGLSTKAPANAA
jgi:hypothetical protein